MGDKVTDIHGNQLQLGALYEFSDSETVGVIAILRKVIKGGRLYKDHNGCTWDTIHECNAPVGAIERPLASGRWYQVRLRDLGSTVDALLSDGCFRLGFDTYDAGAVDVLGPAEEQLSLVGRE